MTNRKHNIMAKECIMWFRVENNQIRLRVIAKPNARKTAILKITNEGLYIAIHAKPHKGEANKALILYLAKVFQIPKSKINLISGEGSRFKTVIFPLTKDIQVLLDNSEKLITK